jgi:hypothetical protein
MGQTSCGTVSEISANNLSGLVDLSGKYLQFPDSTRRENLDFSPNGAQR